MKHTPGPWRIRELVNGHLAVYGQGEYEAVAPRKTGLLSSDARLIAAAPDLLETVRVLLQLVPRFPIGSQSAKQVDEACQLVAKVEGKSD